ncbi:CaiB/BaiF CoA transferase family protein [Chloroflexota bacterium]
MVARALEGIKVADFTWTLVGPILTKNLADYGATVVRVESPLPTGVCPLRVSIPFKDNQPGVDRSGYFAYFNSNKYSLSLDLNQTGGIEVARKLIKWADVVAENFRPGVMEKWGLGYEDIKKFNPDVVMIRSSNQGQTGPYRQKPGLGFHLNGLISLVNYTGWPGSEPVNMMLAYTDYICPMMGTAAVIAALDYRRKTGKGQLLDFSQFEGGVQLFSTGIMDYIVNGREGSGEGNMSPCAAPHAAYRCLGDDRWCAIAVFNNQEWQDLCEIMGNPSWTKEARFATVAGRKKNEDALNLLVEQWTINFTAEQVMGILQAKGIAAGVVQSPRDIFDDPQLQQRDFFWRLNHREIGPFHHMGQVSRLSKTPAEAQMPAPCLGEHTEFICRELLGISEEEFDELFVSGTFGL